MKLHVFAVLLIVAGAYALPSARDVVVVAEPSNDLAEKSIVTDQIRWVIELISDIIRRLGLDPIEIDSRELNIEVPLLLKFNAFIENFRFAGTSDIKIHTLDYNHIFNRLRLDVSLPEISLSVGDSGLEISVLSLLDFDAQFRGSVSIKSIRLAAEVHVDVSIVGGISLRSISINFSLGGIESDLTVVVQDIDGSRILNSILNDRIPKFFEDNENDINRFLEDIISVILNIIWSIN